MLPVNPGPFVIPVPGTAAQIEAARDVWRELKQTFELASATEKAMIAQIVDAIDPIYLRPLLNRTTGQYATSVRDVMAHLFLTHGRITPQQVKAREQAVHNMHYDISQPVDVVFNTIEDLADLAEHASSPMSAQQQIDMAYVIFARQSILQQDVRLWNRRLLVDRTWANMLTHFRDAQNDLSSLPTAGDMYHQPQNQANLVSTIADLVAQRLLDSMPTDEPPEEDSPPPPQANAVQTREADLQSRETALQAQMQEMLALMRNSSTSGNRHHNPRHGGGRGRNDRFSQGGRGRAAPRIAGPRKYCWSHGACAHNSSECNGPSEGHQIAATFAAMMNGSTAGCFWLNT